MANKTGHQPDIKYCSIRKEDFKDVSKDKMKSKGYIRKDGTVSQHTHTY